MSLDLTKWLVKYKTSSILNNSAEYAAKHMFDDSNESCWNSGQGSPQFIMLEFDKEVCISSISLVFQGGFVGQDAIVQVGNNINNMKDIITLECIDDTNEEQVFQLNQSQGIYIYNNNNIHYSLSIILILILILIILLLIEYNKFFKITFNSSTDFYGRITIYNFKLHGFRNE